MSSNLSGGRQLPTRVSNACDRCRRNKSRCDPYRPCSLCTRANVECVAGNYEQQTRSTKRKRTQGPSCEETAPPEALSVKGTTSQAPPSQRLEETSNDRHDTAGQPQTEVIQDAESRRQSVTEAQVDSAMGIAQKVGFQSSFHTGTQTHTKLPDISIEWPGYTCASKNNFCNTGWRCVRKTFSNSRRSCSETTHLVHYRLLTTISRNHTSIT
jgi:hypothetical protein